MRREDPIVEALRVAFLRRLMRETDAFILRGGMRVRQLIGTREVSDVDLVGSNANETDHVLGAVLRGNSDDGVQFHRSRIDSFEGTDGLRVLVQGSVGGQHSELIVDVVHGIDLWPEPQWVSVHGVRIRAAHPASIIATKLRLLVDLGRHWRTKDRDDVLALLRGEFTDMHELAETLAEFPLERLKRVPWDATEIRQRLSPIGGTR